MNNNIKAIQEEIDALNAQMIAENQRHHKVVLKVKAKMQEIRTRCPHSLPLRAGACSTCGVDFSDDD